MATTTRCDLTGKLIPSPSSNAGQRPTYIRHGAVVLRVEPVAACDLHPEALRAIVRDGVIVPAPHTPVVPLPMRLVGGGA